MRQNFIDLFDSSGYNIFECSDNGTSIVQQYSFDFFNYAGIHRSVVLYTTPKVYIQDVSVTTDIVDESTGKRSSLRENFSDFNAISQIGRVFFQITCNDSENVMTAYIQIKDKEGVVVANVTTDSALNGFIDIYDVNLWWPYLMDPNPGEGFIHRWNFSSVV